jgi:putative salt-induced outer membrane protein YdiY
MRNYSPIVPVVGLLTLSCATVVERLGADEVTPPQELSAGELPDWLPPWEEEDGLDWIRLGTGEWLRGELIVLVDDSVEFDSEELDNVDVDWADVEDKSLHMGPLRVRGEQFVVLDESGGGKGVAREDVFRITVGAPRERDRWSGNVGLGWTSRSGNTEETDINLSMSTVRRTPYSRIKTSYDYLFSSADDSEVTNNHRLAGRYDIFKRRRVFFTPFAITAIKDRFQNITYRLTPYSGVGYIILEEGSQDLEALLGVGYRLTRFDSVGPGEDDTEDDFTGVFTTNYGWDLTSDIEFDAEYNATIPFSDTNSTDQYAVLTLSFDIYKNLDLDLKFRWDRIGAPEEDSSGETPDNNDYRWEIVFSWEF